VGTVRYLAPEVARGGDHSVASDLYALGLTLIELAGGTHPYAGLKGLALIQHVAHIPLPAVAELGLSVPPALAAWLDRMVAFAPEHRFAERTAAEAAHGAMVWIHDYNLWMVPAFLREYRPDLNIAFFHHTYFPSADVFNVLPWRREIVGSLLQCDYVGFHIPRQAENFVDVARGVASVKVLEQKACAPRFRTYGCAVGLEEVTTAIEVHGRRIGLGAHPVGLDVGRVRQVLGNPATTKRMEVLRRDLAGTRAILSVERLDYTKGTLDKLVAFETLVAERPVLQG
jgi:trehalose-6-phosphate synthase